MRARLTALPWQLWMTRIIGVLYGSMGALLLIMLLLFLFAFFTNNHPDNLPSPIAGAVIVTGLMIVCLGLGYGLWRQDRRAIWLVLALHGLPLFGSISEVIQALTTGGSLTSAMSGLVAADLLNLCIVGMLGGPRFVAWQCERRELRYWNPHNR